MKTKKDAKYNETHTLERLKERYGIDLAPYGYVRLCDQIGRNFNCYPITIEDDRLTVLTNVSDKPVMLVYNLKTRLVETALPPKSISDAVQRLLKHHYNLG